MLSVRDFQVATGVGFWVAIRADLAGDGWTIRGPYPKRVRIIGRSGRRRFYGFSLTKTVY